MRSIRFEGACWERYEDLRSKRPDIHRSLRRILKEMIRGDPATGTGKPEPLKHQYQGLWSRRISEKDRLIYSFNNKCIYVVAIGGHYDD